MKLTQMQLLLTHINMNLIVRGKATLAKPLACRSYAMAWHAYLQGGVVFIIKYASSENL